MADWRTRIARTLGSAVARDRPLSGGCIADTRHATLEDGRQLAVKIGAPGDRLDIEGRSLDLLHHEGGLPTPFVHIAEDALLVMDFLDNGGSIGAAVEQDAAGHLARLHAATRPLAGLDHDNRIGPLRQVNTETADWLAFFRDQRLMRMARAAHEAGALDGTGIERAERLGSRLHGLVDPPEAMSLLHGDLWGGNVLTDGRRVTGFIDPAIYYGDAEMDLAFSTLFGTFGSAFFDRYRDLRPFDHTGFLEMRRDLWNLYPLLVHATLFGASYGREADRIMRRLAG